MHNIYYSDFFFHSFQLDVSMPTVCKDLHNEAKFKQTFAVQTLKEAGKYKAGNKILLPTLTQDMMPYIFKILFARCTNATIAIQDSKQFGIYIVIIGIFIYSKK